MTLSRVAALLLVLTACGNGAPAQSLDEPPATAPPTTEAPSPTPAPTPSPTPSPTPTPTPTPSPTPTATHSPKPTRTPEPPTPTFEGIRRGVAQGPDYHAILVGQNYGGDGTYNVWANCRPGTVRVTIHEDGVDSGTAQVNVSVEDKTMIHEGDVHDGLVITGKVISRVRIMTGWRGSKPFNIEYDCRNP